MPVATPFDEQAEHCVKYGVAHRSVCGTPLHARERSINDYIA
jgi:hypothetical protein